MKRILSIVLAVCMLLSSAAIFSGCNNKTSNDWPVTVGGVTIDKEPVNIVVLNDVFADIISYIGYDVKMAGRSQECDQEFLYVVPVMGTAAAPDTAAIAAAKADLVIADNTLGADAKSAIESGGAKVATFEVPTTSDALKQLYIDLGTLLGGKTTGNEKGTKGYDELLNMLGTMNTATSNVVQTVAYVYLNANNQPCTFVKGTLEYQFFEYNGNSNVFANQAAPEINLDEFRLGNPNYIFYDNENTLAALQADQSLAGVNALAKSHTCMIPKKAFFRFGKSAEQAIFDMLNYIDKSSKATPDNATPDYSVKATVAPEANAAPAATDAPAAPAAPAADNQNDSGEINYTIEG
ncbi:MAG TPA: hypothetical protein DCY72_03090 [Ruminococcaceae bacterium]|nr:hypothetical protein [Oscillospiraceae bacterium]